MSWFTQRICGSEPRLARRGPSFRTHRLCATIPGRRHPHAPAQLVRAFAALAILCCLPLVACAGSGAPTSTAPASTTAPEVPQATGRAVSFTAEDGITLGGRVFGSGDAGIVLAHMYPADQTSWYATAESLARQGYLVLTFDFRGYGESSGTKDIDRLDRDVDAAIRHLRSEGAWEIALVGASMGGTACLKVAEFYQALSSMRLAAVATLSAPVEFRGLSAAEAMPRLVVPLLFVAAEEDAGATGARQLQQLSGGNGTLLVVPGSDHGTDLLSGDQGERVYTQLLDFLRRHLTP